MKQTLIAGLQLIRFDKPVGTLLLLWPTLIALWLASHGFPPLYLVAIFVLGTFLMRSAGCAINDVADRKFDPFVQRTANRPLAAGVLSVRSALAIASVCAALAACLLILLNPLAQLCAIPALLLAISYPYTKRFFAVPQAYLGLAFSAGIPMAFAAVQNVIPWQAWLLCLANLCWVLAYDTEYAMVDRVDDVALGIHTSALTFGQKDVGIVMLCYTGYLVLMAIIGWLYQLSWGFAGAWLIVCACVMYHYTLIRDRQPAGCFKAFKHNQWLGAVLFFGVMLDFF